MLGLGDLHKGMKDRAQVLNVTDAVEKQGTLKGYLGSDNGLNDNGPSSKKSSLADGQIHEQVKIELDQSLSQSVAVGDRQETNEDVRKARSVLNVGV